MEPWRSDYRFALLMHIICRLHGVDVPIEEFMPKFQPPDPGELEQKLKLIAAIMQGGNSDG